MRPIVARGERRGQRVGRPPFALMGLVEHGHVVGGQQSAADRQIEKEQRVVDDDDIGVLGLFALFEEETIAKMRAELADAIVGVGVELFPLVAIAARMPARNDRRSRSIGPLPDAAASSATTRRSRSRAHVRTSAGRGSGCVL